MQYSEVVTIVRDGERHKIHHIDLALWTSQGWIVDFSEDDARTTAELGQNSEVEKLREEVAQLKYMILSSLKDEIDQLIEDTKAQRKELEKGIENV
jgi:hypothetical protein